MVDVKYKLKALKLILILGSLLLPQGCRSESEKNMENRLKAIEEQNKALQHLSKRDFNSAIKTFQYAIQLDPSNPDLHNNLGITYLEIEKIQDGVIHFSRAIEIDENYERGYYNLGVSYQRMGNFPLSERYYKKAVELIPSYLEAIFNLGIVYTNQGKKQQAIASFKKFIELAPEHKLKTQIEDAKKRISELSK